MQPEIRNRKKGTGLFPSAFYQTQQSMTALEQVQKILEPLLTEDVFLVEMKVKPTNNIKIYLDADSGLGIDKCIKINRALYRQMEEQGIYPDGDFSLEVSSPGLGEPLKQHRQYLKNKGREVEVVGNENEKWEGKLLDVTEDSISLEITEGKGKKAVTKQVAIPFSNIKQTKVLIKF